MSHVAADVRRRRAPGGTLSRDRLVTSAATVTSCVSWCVKDSGLTGRSMEEGGGVAPRIANDGKLDMLPIAHA